MNYRNRNVMITDAKDLNFFENTELDKDDFLINCRNCVLDLSEDQPKVLEHNADLLLSKICNASYNPAATCTLWEKTVKGAVIPPRSEFLAVLGDQKQGNNIETPEALLRKIVREETAGRQAGGGSYRFTAQINRRTLFDEMMKEAQMRRDTSGRNPFEMA